MDENTRVTDPAITEPEVIPAEPTGEPTEPAGVTDPVEPTEPSGEPQPPVFEPDYSYKVYDERKEFPEFIRSLVKDKESEENIRSILCKADGLEPMKEKYGTTKKERDEYKENFNNLFAGVNSLNDLAKKDVGLFLDRSGVSDEQIITYVSSLLKAKEDPDTGRVFDGQRESARDAYTARSEQDRINRENDKLRAENHEYYMGQALSDQTVAPFVGHYDSQWGAGAFEALVNKKGDNLFIQQINISPHEAVRAVYTRLAMQPGAQSFSQPVVPQVQPVTPNFQPPVKPVTPYKPPPTIPNVGQGGTGSPTKVRIKSLEDLKKFAAQRRAELGRE